MRPTPYVGVTGFTSPEEVNAVLNEVPVCTALHLIMVGVLVSAKTLRGGAPKHPERYPDPERLSEIFPNPRVYPDVLNLIHFNTNDAQTLLHDMCWARELAGDACHGFQLNMPWPALNTLEIFKQQYPSTTIVLQCGAKALDAVNHDPVLLADKVRRYENVAEYVLIDPSGGEGKEFNHAFVSVAFREIARHTPAMGLGIAGGLRSETVYRRVVPFMQQYNCSVDVEQGVRDADDHLNVERVRQYIDNARILFYDYAPR